MTVTMSLHSTLVEMALDAYSDYLVFATIADRAFRSRDYSSELGLRMKGAQARHYAHEAALSVYTSSAFALEAYANLIGVSIWAGNEYEDFDKKETVRKYEDIILEIDGSRPDVGRTPFQTVKKLFDIRHRIAHNKGRYIDTDDDLDEILKQNRYKVSPKQSLECLVKMGEELETVGKEKRVPFLYDIARGRIRMWLGKEWYEVQSPLLYRGACFPSRIEYENFVVRHTVAEPPPNIIDSEKRIIQTL